MKTAEVEKDRLEWKQRAVRKYNELNKIEHQAAYFDTWENPADKQVYYVYNKKYFEEDRKEQSWGRLIDLFSEQMAPEVAQYLPDKKRSAKKRKEWLLSW